MPGRLLVGLCAAWLLGACAPAQEESAPAPVGESAAAPVTESVPPGAEAPVPPEAAAGTMLDRVRSRGRLICGVNDQLPGFGYVGSDNVYAGFDVDFCRALAAAVFGDPTAVDFRPLTTQERFAAVQNGEVDVLIRNTTWTLSRDTQNALDFAPTTFYDGQGVMVRADSGIADLAGLDGADICVQAGTTTEKNIADGMRKIGAAYEPVVFENPDQTYTAYESGRCDAVTSDKSQLASRQSILDDPAAHTILDVTLSKEPLGPAVLQGDAQWRDLVAWVVFGLIAAEEAGVTAANVAQATASDDPEVLRLVGAEEALGEGLGVSNDFMVNVIAAVGNYGEIYARNLGPDTPFNLPRGPNRLWTEGGLLYSPPFR